MSLVIVYILSHYTAIVNGKFKPLTDATPVNYDLAVFDSTIYRKELFQFGFVRLQHINCHKKLHLNCFLT